MLAQYISDDQVQTYKSSVISKPNSMLEC